MTRLWAFFLAISLAAPAVADETATSSGGEDLFYQDSVYGHTYRTAEILFNVFTSYHVGSIPHEAVHAATAYAFGTPTDHWVVKPMLEAVAFTVPDEQRTTADRMATALSAPLVTRLTLDLPRWAYTPVPGTWWDRWTATYWVIQYSTLWVTAAGSWSDLSSGSQSGWDFGNAARAPETATKNAAARVMMSPPKSSVCTKSFKDRGEDITANQRNPPNNYCQLAPKSGRHRWFRV